MDVTGAGRYTYGWDGVGRNTLIRNPFGERITLSYDAAGRKTLEWLPAGVRSTWQYDSGDRLIRLAHVRSDGTTVASYGYRYDNAGNKIGSDEFLLKPGSGSDSARLTWSYDATYRLTREERNGSGTTVTRF